LVKFGQLRPFSPAAAGLKDVIDLIYFRFKRSWPLGPPRCMKTMHRNPDGRFRSGADCLKPLTGSWTGPDAGAPERNDLQLIQTSLFKNGHGPVLETVGGEFQPPFATVYPGAGAHHFDGIDSIFELNRWGPPADCRQTLGIDAERKQTRLRSF